MIKLKRTIEMEIHYSLFSFCLFFVMKIHILRQHLQIQN